MKMIKVGKSAGANEYEVFDDRDDYIGFLHKEYSPWFDQFGHKTPAYVWYFTEYPDDLHFNEFDSYKQAIDYIGSLGASK